MRNKQERRKKGKGRREKNLTSYCSKNHFITQNECLKRISEKRVAGSPAAVFSENCSPLWGPQLLGLSGREPPSK